MLWVFNLVFLNVLIGERDAVFETIIPHLTCTMKQLHERFMTFKAYIEELARISSISSINLSLRHQFQLLLMVSAASGKAATSVLAEKSFFE